MSAALIAKLIESGTPAALVAEAAMEFGRAEAAREALARVEAAQEAKREAKRQGNRDRQQRYREAHADGNASNALRDVTSVNNCDGPSPQSPPLKSTPDPKKITPPLTPQPIVEGARPKFAAPDGVTGDQWKAFRQQRKKALNERAYTLLCNKLRDLAAAGWPPGEMIDLAIERGWETVFEPKDQANGRTASNVSSLRRHRPNLTDLLRASSGDPEDHFGTGLALPASGNG